MKLFESKVLKFGNENYGKRKYYFQWMKLEPLRALLRLNEITEYESTK